MRTFHLEREVDVSGVSGTGVVAEGAEFADGAVAIRWIVGEHHSTVTWASVASVEAIHGHGGATKIVFHGDWEPLGENIFGHAVMMSPLGRHDDGRYCVFHSRLGSWVFENDKRCLRDHA